MKKNIVFLVALLFIACSKNTEDTVEFTILSINDVYEIDALEGGKSGGLARVETLHKQLLSENPNTILVHGADFLNPSLLGTMKDENGERFRGKQMIDVMNAMNFDLVAFGNHEFDLDYKDFQKRLNESTFQWISTNNRLVGGDNLVPLFVEKNGNRTDIPKTVTFEFKNASGNKINVGFISATIDSNPTDYIDYGDKYEDAINAYKVLEPKTDVVLALTHLALHQDKLLSKSLPEIPLIIGGHEHTNMLVPVGDALISKADANAKTAYVHRISVDIKTDEIKIDSELVSIDETIERDKEVEHLVQQWNVQLDKKLREILSDPYEVIYTAETPLDGRDTPIRSTQTNLGVLIAESMSEAFDNDVDCAIINGGSIRIDDELHGAITGVDIFRVLPFGGGINKVDMTGALLEKVLNYGRLKAGTGAYLQLFNATYNKESKKWGIAGKPIESNKTYKVALTDYLLLGFDIPFLKNDNPELLKVYNFSQDHLSSDIRKVVINYLKN
ncbi:bifunctional metallophosphatase/5'-nucleotidase [Urechidicola vernalis]|uniref:Bifunctional metallophosphatase/5'-nucleotidase n=1 Tax=Urechidicola vernalis TaxID=3075600 RepID=A0ABU2Y3G7_9FLAO|nr:bifunctional metallophosphatase/5'-nucleotidase [Urechidicola sp. P050]MDT0552194.1 bifunctional metallophosphatase/5'-nucleotidase [Urechidicola sp. P050]